VDKKMMKKYKENIDSNKVKNTADIGKHSKIRKRKIVGKGKIATFRKTKSLKREEEREGHFLLSIPI
jgi:hypothetical protein